MYYYASICMFDIVKTTVPMLSEILVYIHIYGYF